MRKLLFGILTIISFSIQAQTQQPGVSIYTSPRLPKDSVSKGYIGISKKNGNVVTQYSMRADSLLQLVQGDSIVYSANDFTGTGTPGSPLAIKGKADSAATKTALDGKFDSTVVKLRIRDSLSAYSVYFSNVFTGTGAQLSPIGLAPITEASLSTTINLPAGATATTQTAGDNSTKLANTSYVDNAASEDFIQTLQAIGSNIKAITVGVPFSSFVTGLTLSDGILYTVPVYFKKPETLTGIRIVMQTAGAFTGDNENRVGLYSESGGTYTLIASSTNNLTLWTAAVNSLVSIPFTSTVNVSKGKYYVGIIYNNSAETTAPRIFASTDYNNSVWTAITTTATNSNRLYGSRGSSTLLSTFAASTLAQPSSNIPLVMPY